MPDRLRALIHELDRGEDFSLEEMDDARLAELIRLARQAPAFRREEIDTRAPRGRLLAQLASAVSLASRDEAEHAALVLDEFCRGAIERGGGRALARIADSLAAEGVPLDPVPVRLYGLHAAGDETGLLEALRAATGAQIPPSILGDAALLLFDVGEAGRALRLAERAATYHVRRREPAAALNAWMVLDATGLASLDTLLHHLRALYPLAPGEVTAQARALAERLAQTGDQNGLLRVLRMIVRESGRVPDFLLRTLRQAFPEAEALGSRLDLLPGMVLPAAPDPLAHVETVLRFLPGRYALISGKMVARVRETDGKTIRLEGPGGERFEEVFSRERFELLADDDYRVRLRFSPGAVRAWMARDPVGFVRHVVERNGGPVLDEHLREELSSEVPRRVWEEWLEDARTRLRKDRACPVEFSMRTMSFQVKAPPRKKDEG